ncbi:MAG TPA: zinc ribbon domain-containing protein [Pyrinomonadaceae bacterium]|nr:zinc ribbon domain-containing protein [Pyrinomonadaceae bacterium]
MFCPKCGKSDQAPEAFCRGCGTYLPDLNKPVKGPVTPQQHVTANIVLSSMSIVAGITMAILLWSILGFRPETHPLIYVAAGLFMAMAMWHVQTLWRSVLLRKQIKLVKRSPVIEQLPEPNFENVVPASVVERTTRDLTGTKHSSSQTK